MITIFEGPDGAGKTTLVEAYERWIARKGERQAFRVHHGPYLGESGDEIATHYLDTLIKGDDPRLHVLMERCWVSEGIYGPVARHANRLSKGQRFHLNNAAVAARSVMIICLPDFGTCRANYMKRKEVEYLENDIQLQRVYEGYQAFMNDQYSGPPHQSPIRTFGYNYTTEPSRRTFIDKVEELRSIL